MRIGLLGAPGSGKTQLARALGKEFNLKVIDGYAQRLQKKTGLALGPWSSYSELFMVAGHRLAEEEKADHDNTVKPMRVTVGTMADTLTYAAVRSDVVLHRNDEGVRAAYRSAQTAMQGLALMFQEIWDYDIAFYLPYTPEQQREKAGTWESALDGGYLPVLESFQVPFVYTITGTLKDRITIVRETIKLVQNHKTESPEASPVEE